MKSRLNINPHCMLGNIEEISRYNIIVGGRGNNMNRKVKVVEKPEIVEGKKMSNKVKRFKNVYKLSFEELIVYLKSTRMAGAISKFDCFLSNYKDNSICIHGRCCGMSCICDMINEELIKLDNLSTATEIEEALKPVYLYREEIRKIGNVERIKKGKQHEREELEHRLNFEYNFCSECLDRRVCKNVYDSSRCKALFKALKDNGFVKEPVQKKEEKGVQFPVNMDEMQKDIMTELLNARKECTEENLLTARGCVAIIDALFYLVKERPIVPAYCAGIDMGDPKGDRTGFVDNDAICKVTGNYCSRCTPGPCEHRKEN